MSDGQHVGRLADAITEEPGGSRAALARVMKPQGHEYRGTGGTTGDGGPCLGADGKPTGHGRMYVSKSGSGREYCPNQSHDDERMRPNA